MGTICESMNIGGKKIKAMIDSGANTNFMRKDFAREIGLKGVKIRAETTVGDARKQVGMEEYAVVGVNIQRCKTAIPVIIREKMPEKVILGTSFLQEFEVAIDFEKDKLKIKRCIPKQLRMVSQQVTCFEE